VKSKLPLIAKPLTAQQLRQRVVAELAARNGNGKANGKVAP
jgi:hypothetical protein